MYPEIRDKELETVSQADLYKSMERDALKHTLEFVLERSEFYKNKFKDYKSGAHIIQDFDSVPFTEKKEIIEDQNDFPPYGSNLSIPEEEIIRVHRTSGTTGRPVFIALTQSDVEATVRSGSRGFWAAGLRPDDTVFHCLNYCLWMGGYTDLQSLEATGANVIPYGVGNSKNLIDSILYLKPTAIHCTISYLAKLEVLLGKEFNMLPAELGLKKGFFAGEGGIQDPRNRKRIEDTWGLKAMDANYGVSDVLSMFGSECYQQDGMHFMGQGNILVELIDPSSGKVLKAEKGAKGEFVITNIAREGQPLIRFRTHDVVEIADHNKCKCGRASFRFRVMGRSDDMIVVKGINVYPGAIGRVISEFHENVTGEYQIVAEKNKTIDKIMVKVEAKEGITFEERSGLKNIICKKIKENMDVRADIELIGHGDFPRTEGKTKRLMWV